MNLNERRIERLLQEFRGETPTRFQQFTYDLIDALDIACLRFIKNPIDRLRLMWLYLKQGYRTENIDGGDIICDIIFKSRLLAEQLHKVDADGNREKVKSLLKYRYLCRRLHARKDNPSRSSMQFCEYYDEWWI